MLTVKSNLNELLSDCGTIDAVSWQPPANMSYELWEKIGQRFQQVSGSINWWLGDWINEGEKRYGETYAQAIELTGNRLEQLKNCAWVSNAVKKSTRVDFLTWTHHRHIAHLPEVEQSMWLEHAIKHELSSRDLKHALELANAQKKPLPKPELDWVDDTPQDPPLPEQYSTFVAPTVNSDNDPPFADPRSVLYTQGDGYNQEADSYAGDADNYNWTDAPDRKINLAAANHAISDTPGYDGDEWYTPSVYIDAARSVMGWIDLDPASCEAAQETVKADSYLTKDDDSLRDDIIWEGNIWLNPPYSMPLIDQFVDKLIDQFDQGFTLQAVIITNNSSDTAWFHKLLSRFPACFTKGRVKFWRPNHEAFGTRQGQTIFYLGDNVKKFCQEFSKLGVVVKRHDH